MRLKVHLRGRHLSPERVVLASFAATILLGALLLALPFSNTDGAWHLSSSSLFLSTSATCVTGLDPVGIGESLTHFGIFVMTLLVELGGIGVMTIGTFFFIAMGRRLSVSEERVIMNTLGEDTVNNISRTILRTLYFTFSWEVVGAAIIAWRLYSHYQYSLPRAAAHGLFISIMAFCNAGFGLFPDNMCRYASDPVMMIACMVLIVVGGIGFIVHANLLALRPWKKNRLARGRLTLHSYLVLKITVFILLTGTLAFLALEWFGAFEDFSFIDKVVGASFQTVTSRTAGLMAVPTPELRSASLILTMVVMFIGAAPGSTAGGIKITTAAVLYATVRNMLHNRQAIELHGRSLPVRVVKNAIAITVLSLIVITGATLIMSLTEESTGQSMFSVFFEIISAFATTGLSLGATPALTPPGRFCIIVCMFVGRLGPVSLAMSMSSQPGVLAKRYPEENIVVG